MEDIKSVEVTENVVPNGGNQNNNYNQPKKDNTKTILLVILLIIVLLVPVGIFGTIIFKGLSIFNKVKNEGLTNISEAQKAYQEQKKTTQSIIEDVKNEKEKQSQLLIEEQKKTNFNRIFESSVGRKPGMSSTDIIDYVIENNKKAVLDAENGRIITLIWDKKQMTDPTELKNSKTNMGGENRYNAYETSVEYDKDGYVNQVIIETLNEPYM